MAEQAHLTLKEGPWRLSPRRMLRMRARSWTIRDGFADILRGLHIREEVDDFLEIRGMKQLPATVVEDKPLEGFLTRGSPRPKRSAGSTSAKRPAPVGATATQIKPAAHGGGQVMH